MQINTIDSPKMRLIGARLLAQGAAFAIITLPLLVHADTPTLKNPLGEIKTVDALVKFIINLALQIGLPIAALFIMYAGYMFVTARGNTSQLDAAKETLLYTIIGSAVLLGAYVITDILTGTLNKLR